MKLLIVALLTVFSTNVLAEWTEVGGGDGITSYADPSTIRKSGNKVKMWSLYDLRVAEKSYDGMRYLSSISQDEYDCKEETYRILALNLHSKNMGAGEVVYSSGNVHSEFTPMPPTSRVWTRFKVACGK